jgi:hypothetical protein
LPLNSFQLPSTRSQFIVCSCDGKCLRYLRTRARSQSSAPSGWRRKRGSKRQGRSRLMSTTPEITGRARGGGNGRPAVRTMHGRRVGSSESARTGVEVHPAASTGVTPLRPRVSARARIAPIAGRPRRRDRPHPKRGGNSFSISQLRPRPVSATGPAKIVAGRMNLSAGCCD